VFTTLGLVGVGDRALERGLTVDPERVEQLPSRVCECRQAGGLGQHSGEQMRSDVGVDECARIAVRPRGEDSSHQLRLGRLRVVVGRPTGRHGQQLADSRASRALRHRRLVLREQFADGLIQTLQIALSQGDADQGRDDTLGGRLDLGVLGCVAVVIPLGQHLAVLANKNRPDVLQIDRAVREVVVDRRSELGTRHGRTRHSCRRHGRDRAAWRLRRTKATHPGALRQASTAPTSAGSASSTDLPQDEQGQARLSLVRPGGFGKAGDGRFVHTVPVRAVALTCTTR
jgi:hypothetical protein